jgi:tetratricopeptide (TPR) repeat protein
MIAPLLLLGGSLLTMLVVVIRKVPQLSLLDVENAPEIKEEKKKMEFLKKRVEARADKTRKERRAEWQPVVAQFTRIQSAFRQYVGNIERMIAREKVRVERRIARRPTAHAQGEDLRTMLQEGGFAYDQGDWETAEKKYLAVIRLDAKNKEAYLGLGNVYRKQGQSTEARETYAFVAQLDPNDDAVRVKLAELAEEAGDTAEAIRQYEAAVVLNANLAPRFGKLGELLSGIGQYQTASEAARQALELEPENPKYLDMMAETSILSGRKDAALAAYEALRMANPENQKLAALKDRIEKMVDNN